MQCDNQDWEAVEYLMCKADWMEKFLLDNRPKEWVFRPTGAFSNPSPFRVTKTEILTEKEDLNNQPNGRGGYWVPPGISCDAAQKHCFVPVSQWEEMSKTLKEKLKEPLEAGH